MTNIAFTARVPDLSAAEVWSGIVATVRQPEQFVDYISRTEIFDDTGNSLRRVLHFIPGASHRAPGNQLDQNVVLYPNLKVEFVAAATGKATLSVSRSATEDSEAVYLTQAFEIPFPTDVEPGSELAMEQEKHLSGVARRNVMSNIETFRGMKAAGKL